MPTESPSEFIECAVCHKLTDENHAEKINDFWICLVCEFSAIRCSA